MVVLKTATMKALLVVLVTALLETTVAEEVKNNDLMTVEPKTILVPRGGKFHIMCRAPRPIKSCIFKFGTEERFVFSNRLTISRYNNILEYYGKGFKAGECGVRVKWAEMNYEDSTSTCTVTLADSDEVVKGEFNISILYKPEDVGPVDLKILQEDLTVGGELRAECVTYRKRPAPNITWWLDDEQIFTGLEDSSIETLEWVSIPNEYIRHQQIKMKLTADHHDKKLTCKAEHVNVDAPKASRVYRIDMSYQVTGVNIGILNQLQAKPQSVFKEGDQLRAICVVRSRSTSSSIPQNDVNYGWWLDAPLVAPRRPGGGNREFQSGFIGKSVNLWVLVHAHPRPTVTWFGPTPDVAKWKQECQPYTLDILEKGDYYECYLKIPSFEEFKENAYTATISNVLGSVEYKVKLLPRS